MSHRSRDAKTNRTLNCRQNWKKPGNNPFLKDINSSFKIAFYRLLLLFIIQNFNTPGCFRNMQPRWSFNTDWQTGRDVRGRPTVIQGGQV